MANKSLFASYAGKLLPRATAKNREVLRPTSWRRVISWRSSP